MKLTINKKLFLQSWNLAERSTTGSGSMNILSSVLVKASFEEVLLQATDVRTSIICTASGVTVVEPGDAVFPIKMVSDLFKKAAGEEFTLSVEDGKVLLKAGRGKYNFSTYPVSEFPKLPSSSDAEPFCTLKVKELAEVLDEGTLAASTGEEFPLYLSSANFHLTGGQLKVISTDTRRLALSGVAVSSGADREGCLLPMKGVKEVQRILGSMDPEEEVTVLFDDAQFYFKVGNVEFTVRRVESRFPPYEKILPKEHATDIFVDRGQLISALERVDVIVRDYNRMVVLDVEPGDAFTMRGKAPDFGTAREDVSADVTGEKLRIAVNSKFFMDSLKVLREPDVRLSFNGASGHMAVKRREGENFICLIAPINLSDEELNMEE
jgi:DNA polymerase-3 subunit beta